MATETLPESKLCTKCRAIKPRADFQPRPNRPNALRSHCRRCRKEAQNIACRKWYHSNPGFCAAAKRRRLMWSYGITLDDYNDMVAEQGGLCAICLEPPSAGVSLNVDHCHASGRVRRLLCSACNMGIGIFRDDPARLEAAIRYLRDSDAWRHGPSKKVA